AALEPRKRGSLPNRWSTPGPSNACSRGPRPTRPDRILTRTGERGQDQRGHNDGMALTTDVRPTDDDPRVARVEAACRALGSDDGRRPTLDELAALVGVSPASLRREFKDVLGVTPKQYADQLRVERLRAGLRAGRDVAGAMYDAGYGS